MSEYNITVEGGTSKRLLTAGKYCDRDIVVTAEGGADSGDTITLVNNTGGAIFVGAANMQNGGATQLLFDSSTGNVMLAISASSTVTNRISVATTAGTVMQNFWGKANVNISGGGLAATYYLSMIIIMGIVPGSTVTLTT